jgi:hypothetical protein
MIRRAWREWIAPGLIIVALAASLAVCIGLLPGCVAWSADYYHW